MNNNRRGEHSQHWFRTLMGHVLMSAAGVLALICLFCLIFAADTLPWWVSVIGLAFCGVLALIGDRMRTRTIHVDPQTGKVPKRNL